jgi:hypothetical protein
LKPVSDTPSSRQTSLTAFFFVNTAYTALRSCAEMNRDRFPIAHVLLWSRQPAAHPDQCQGPPRGRAAADTYDRFLGPSRFALTFAGYASVASRTGGHRCRGT